MKAATYVSAGKLQLLDQAHHPPLQTFRGREGIRNLQTCWRKQCLESHYR